MSVTQTARFPDDLHAALKDYCDRRGSSANAEIIVAVRKHLGLPTFEERVEFIEKQLTEITDRLKALEKTSAIATQQFSGNDTQSTPND
jgi:hypothetical protein